MNMNLNKNEVAELQKFGIVWLKDMKRFVTLDDGPFGFNGGAFAVKDYGPTREILEIREVVEKSLGIEHDEYQHDAQMQEYLEKDVAIMKSLSEEKTADASKDETIAKMSDALIDQSFQFAEIGRLSTRVMSNVMRFLGVSR
jgi:hypothetical protein